MSSNVYNLLPHLTPGEPGLLLGSVSVKQPAPASFADPLHVELPDWSDTNYFTISNWPACHGALLPQCGADVLILVDSQKNKRVVWWDGLTGFPPQAGVGAADGTSNLALPPGAFGARAFTFPAGLPATAIGGVTTPTVAPSTSNLAILSNGAGGSFWGTVSAGGGSSLVARAYRSGAFTVPNAGWTKIPLDTVSFDPSGLFDISVNHRFNAPVAGYYLVDGQVSAIQNSAGGTSSIFIARNGVVAAPGIQGVDIATSGTTGTAYCSASGIIFMNAGDYLELYIFSNNTAYALANAEYVNYLCVAAVSALPGVAGTTTAARGRAGSTFTFASGTTTKVPIDTVNTSDTFDPASRFDLVNHRYVCPASGYYQVNAAITGGTATGDFSALILQNGVQVSAGVESTASGTQISNISDILFCNSGDHIELWGFNTGTAISNPTIAAFANFMSVVQVGTSMNFTSAGGDLTGTYPNPTVAGGVKLLPGDLIPSAASSRTGCLLCDGTQYATATWPALFTAIGYTYGGSGVNFKVPDLRGRVPLGAGTGTATGATTHTLGSQPTSGSGGEETHLLTSGESGVANHSHVEVGGGYFASSNNDGLQYTGIAGGTGGDWANPTTGGVNGGATNASSAHNIMQPISAVNWFIKT